MGAHPGLADDSGRSPAPPGDTGFVLGADVRRAPGSLFGRWRVAGTPRPVARGVATRTGALLITGLTANAQHRSGPRITLSTSPSALTPLRLSCSDADVGFSGCQQVLERADPGFHNGVVVNPAVRGAQQVGKQSYRDQGAEPDRRDGIGLVGGYL